MWKTRFKLTFGLGVMVLAAQSLQAQTSQYCAPRDSVVERLAEKYGESRQSIGLGTQGSMVETFASSDTGSWTITVTSPNGVTCLIASGQSFEKLAEAQPVSEKDA